VSVTRHAYEVPGWGVCELWSDGERVIEHALVRLSRGDARAHGPGCSPKGTPASPENTLSQAASSSGDGFVPDLCRLAHRFLAGEPVDPSGVPLDLDWCTSFQRAVIDTLRSIPRGELVSYGELAALAGAPGAARAAGTVCAQNRFWLFVPCHRVVAADGIGGYGSSGVALKRRLLALEGIRL